ncbi:MAG TPA: alpha/beta fold hydrolase [Alphaproteobacteria bacterium]|nr:alpha/beta fold hydrolase [Alphaproteobacteria bacterium]
MSGTKATALNDFAEATGRAYTRFDYRGHGRSSGRFEELSIGDWIEDALTVLDRVARGRQILIGSSMGAWIALLVALRRPERVAGLVTMAAAPDFTEDLVWARLDVAERRRMIAEGRIERPSLYSSTPDIFTLRLVEDGRRHLLLRGPIPLSCPVRMLHGTADMDVPWRCSLALMERLQSTDARLTLIKDADHRLSEPRQIEAMLASVAELASG